ncbi:cupredoxin family protein [Stappia sp. F7233]|uniref:Cupredoxin family protein n=2 Tax=Stappia albiluteola TaxID=2758565 RepID=A0A839A924_9HYPH|nr:cupredoxin family protein [Stappia albiluteola]
MTTTVSAILYASAAAAGGSHAGGHGDAAKTPHHGADTGGHGHALAAEHHRMAVGEPGKASKVTRSITVTMRETDDGDMIFEPNQMQINHGETIRFIIENKGELAHEFVLDDHHGISEHKALMEKFPEMEHDDPNSVHLEPGSKAEIIWSFVNDGDFEFACLIPGHYEAGMRGGIDVVNSLARN